jgi:hypothetical protein
LSKILFRCQVKPCKTCLCRRTASSGGQHITTVPAIISKFRVQCGNYSVFPSSSVSGYQLTVWFHQWRNAIGHISNTLCNHCSFKNRTSLTCKFEELKAPSLPMTYQAWITCEERLMSRQDSSLLIMTMKEKIYNVTLHRQEGQHLDQLVLQRVQTKWKHLKDWSCNDTKIRGNQYWWALKFSTVCVMLMSS